MIRCDRCLEYKTCKQVCNKVNAELKAQGIYSSDWIGPQNSREQKEKLGFPRFKETPTSYIESFTDNKTRYES